MVRFISVCIAKFLEEEHDHIIRNIHICNSILQHGLEFNCVVANSLGCGEWLRINFSVLIEQISSKNVYH